MANPTLLTMPLCVNADKNTIPPTDAGISGLFSEELGFQDINSLPLASGGKAPNRRDFNGVFALLGGIAFYAQKGWQFEFDETQNYFAGCVVRDTADGKLYECLNDVSASSTHPNADSTNWKATAIDTSTFANKQLSNLDTSNLTCHLVVDSYYNSSTGDWYRVYDDGWVEQGGIVSVNSNTENYLVNLLKPMADNNYFLTTTVCIDVATNLNAVTITTLAGNALANTTNRATTTSFYINYLAHTYIESGYGDKRWYVAGMGASV